MTKRLWDRASQLQLVARLKKLAGLPADVAELQDLEQLFLGDNTPRTVVGQGVLAVAPIPTRPGEHQEVRVRHPGFAHQLLDLVHRAEHAGVGRMARRR